MRTVVCALSIVMANMAKPGTKKKTAKTNSSTSTAQTDANTGKNIQERHKKMNTNQDTTTTKNANANTSKDTTTTTNASRHTHFTSL